MLGRDLQLPGGQVAYLPTLRCLEWVWNVENGQLPPLQTSSATVNSSFLILGSGGIGI